MHFILAHGSIQKFDGSKLRQAYQVERKVDLEATPSRIGLPTMFGGTDVIRRRGQVSFLEKIRTAIDHLLDKSEERKSRIDWEKHLTGCRFMVAACLYVQNQIDRSKDNSALYRLINKYLGVTKKNYMDEKDIEVFYQTAFQVTSQTGAFSYLNALLQDAGQEPFSESEWDGFANFISIKENEIKKKKIEKPTSSNYPAIEVAQSVFEPAFRYVGATIGWVLAEALSGSSVAAAPRAALTTYVGTALSIVGSGGTAGIALLAPTIATKLLGNFCNISISSMTGAAFGLVGKGAGAAVGFPVDLSLKLMKSTGALLISYTTEPPSLAPIDGIRLADGVVVAQGYPMKFSFVPENHLVNDQLPLLKITDEGTISQEKKGIKLLGPIVEELEDEVVAESSAPVI